MSPLLPKGFTSGFAMRGADVVYETQLRRDGYTEVSHLVRGNEHPTWVRFLPWIANVGRRYFAPEWLAALRDRIWPLMTIDAGQELVDFLKVGPAEERARALVAAADLAGAPGSVEATKAALILIREWDSG